VQSDETETLLQAAASDSCKKHLTEKGKQVFAVLSAEVREKKEPLRKKNHSSGGPNTDEESAGRGEKTSFSVQPVEQDESLKVCRTKKQALR